MITRLTTFCQHALTCCNTLQHIARTILRLLLSFALQIYFRHSATHCDTLQLGIPQGPQTITRSTTLQQRTAIHGNTPIRPSHTSQHYCIHSKPGARRMPWTQWVILDTDTQGVMSYISVTLFYWSLRSNIITAQMIYWHNFTAHIRTTWLYTFAPLSCTRSHHFTAHIHTTLLHTFGAPRKAHLRLNLALTFSNNPYTSFNLTPVLHVLYARACGGGGGGGSPST